MDTTVIAAVAAVVAAALAIVGVAGIVVPVLPGSLALLAGLAVWALLGGSPWGWLTFGVGAALVVVGAAAQYVLTGRTLKREQIPSRSVVIGVLCGVAGLFVIPLFGLPLGLAVGLLASEYWRVRDLRTALSTSWTALKSVGLGVLVELACGLTAATVLAAGILFHLL